MHVLRAQQVDLLHKLTTMRMLPSSLQSPKPVCEQLRDVLDGHVVVPPWQPAEEEGIWSYENLEQRVVGLQPDVPCVKSGFFEKPV